MPTMGAASHIGSGPLQGIRVIEIAGQGPGPFAAMMLSDMGAEVLRLDRADAVNSEQGLGPPTDFVLQRGRRSVAVDLKHPEGASVVLRLVEQADVLIEGFRPGVLERLGVGPEECLARNSRLVYARVTGWGQQGPFAQMPGHDINYIALSGVLHSIGSPGGPPAPPLNLVGDYGGGMMLAFGVVCAVLEARVSGEGQVLDAAMLDASALMAGLFYGMYQRGEWTDQRGANLLDGGAHFYGVYETSEGGWVSVGAIEPKFYEQLLKGLELDGQTLPDQYDRDSWPQMRERLAAIFLANTREHWCTVLEPLGPCFAPVLTMAEAFEHHHNLARELFMECDGVLQPAPAPRFSRTPGRIAGGAPKPGEHTGEALRSWGFDPGEVGRLASLGAIRSP
jgi:alpha-methylacyl-CoA racemase